MLEWHANLSYLTVGRPQSFLMKIGSASNVYSCATCALVISCNASRKLEIMFLWRSKVGNYGRCGDMTWHYTTWHFLGNLENSNPAIDFFALRAKKPIRVNAFGTHPGREKIREHWSVIGWFTSHWFGRFLWLVICFGVMKSLWNLSGITV